MANQTANLPAPAANGAGAWVDVSTFGALKTISVEGNGGVFEPSVTVEFSNESAATSGTPVCPTFQLPGEDTVMVAARWMRAVVSNYRGGGAPSVDVGGTDEGTVFATLVAPAGNGAGSGVDTSSLPSFQTVQVLGRFRGTLNVEISEDGGTRWSTLCSFTQAGALSFEMIAEFMRVKRVGVPQVDPGRPTINIGATSTGGGGGGGDSGDPQRFTYTVTGAEPDLSELVIALPAARASANYQVQVAQGTAAFGLNPNVANSSRTTTQFVLTLSNDATTGDVFWFTVVDPT